MLGVHLMTWGAYQSGWFHVQSYVASAVSVDWIDLKILTVLSIFFLAFHVNQCFQRQGQSSKTQNSEIYAPSRSTESFNANVKPRKSY